MLLNPLGHDVTKMHDELRSTMHPKQWEKVRPEVVFGLREVLSPNREHVGKMFKLGERARLV